MESTKHGQRKITKGALVLYTITNKMGVVKSILDDKSVLVQYQGTDFDYIENIDSLRVLPKVGCIVRKTKGWCSGKHGVLKGFTINGDGSVSYTVDLLNVGILNEFIIDICDSTEIEYVSDAEPSFLLAKQTIPCLKLDVGEVVTAYEIEGCYNINGVFLCSKDIADWFVRFNMIEYQGNAYVVTEYDYATGMYTVDSSMKLQASYYHAKPIVPAMYNYLILNRFDKLYALWIVENEESLFCDMFATGFAYEVVDIDLGDTHLPILLKSNEGHHRWVRASDCIVTDKVIPSVGDSARDTRMYQPGMTAEEYLNSYVIDPSIGHGYHSVVRPEVYGIVVNNTFRTLIKGEKYQIVDYDRNTVKVKFSNGGTLWYPLSSFKFAFDNAVDDTPIAEPTLAEPFEEVEGSWGDSIDDDSMSLVFIGCPAGKVNGTYRLGCCYNLIIGNPSVDVCIIEDDNGVQHIEKYKNFRTVNEYKAIRA